MLIEPLAKQPNDTIRRWLKSMVLHVKGNVIAQVKNSNYYHTT